MWMSGEVTSIPNLTRSGRPCFSLASSAPAAFLGLATQRGTIAPGMAADLVLLDDQRNVVRTWIDGQG